MKKSSMCEFKSLLTMSLKSIVRVTACSAGIERRMRVLHEAMKEAVGPLLKSNLKRVSRKDYEASLVEVRSTTVFILLRYI